jgi:hypothetical protein
MREVASHLAVLDKPLSDLEALVAELREFLTEVAALAAARRALVAELEQPK